MSHSFRDAALCLQLEDVIMRLKRIEAQCDRLEALLTPVHAHASWVDGLRDKLARLRLVPNRPALVEPVRMGGIDPLDYSSTDGSEDGHDHDGIS